jgi:hypothetical protein
MENSFPNADCALVVAGIDKQEIICRMDDLSEKNRYFILTMMDRCIGEEEICSADLNAVNQKCLFGIPSKTVSHIYRLEFQGNDEGDN